MGFPGRTSTPPTPAAGAPPPPPTSAGAPPPPAPPAPSGRMLWVLLNGATVAKTEAEARLLPPTTPALFQGDSAWLTIGAILPAAVQQLPAGPYGQPQRPAFGGPGQPQQSVAAGMPTTNIFAGVENAQVIRRGNNINPGDYVAKVLSSEYKTGRKGNYLIIELLILVSSYDPNDPQKSGCNCEGTNATIFIKQNDSFLGNVKEVILAVSGFDEHGHPRDETDPVTQEECNALISAEQPYKGAMVYLEARGTITQKEGKPFTRISWWPCPIVKDATGAVSPDLAKLAQSRGN